MKRIFLLSAIVVGLAGCHRTIEFGTRHERFADPNNTPIVIDDPVLLRFAENQHDFRVLMGGGTDKGAPGRLKIRNSMVKILLEAGWAYLVGQYPFIETERVTIGATGTTFAVEIAGDVHRIYLLKSLPRKGIVIELKPGIPSAAGAVRRRVVTEQSFVEVTRAPDGTCTIGPPQPIRGNRAVAEFVRMLNSRRTAANLDGWPTDLP